MPWRGAWFQAPPPAHKRATKETGPQGLELEWPPNTIAEQPLAYRRRAVVNQVRDRWRHKVVELRQHFGPGDTPVLGAEDALIWQLFRSCRCASAKCLPLCYYDNPTLPEISALLGCPLGTVKSLAHRGLKCRRKEMEK